MADDALESYVRLPDDSANDGPAVRVRQKGVEDETGTEQTVVEHVVEVGDAHDAQVARVRTGRPDAQDAALAMRQVPTADDTDSLELLGEIRDLLKAILMALDG